MREKKNFCSCTITELIYIKEKKMPINKGYLTAETGKESDEVYTPAYAIKPIIKHISTFLMTMPQYGALLMKKIAIL